MKMKNAFMTHSYQGTFPFPLELSPVASQLIPAPPLGDMRGTISIRNFFRCRLVLPVLKRYKWNLCILCFRFIHVADINSLFLFVTEQFSNTCINMLVYSFSY